MDMNFVTNLILASVRMATPLIFVSLAELYSQRAGLTNIGLEGIQMRRRVKCGTEF